MRFPSQDYTWGIAAHDLEISRDFGKTWEPCRKRAVTEETENEDDADASYCQWRNGMEYGPMDQAITRLEEKDEAVLRAIFKAGKEAK